MTPSVPARGPWIDHFGDNFLWSNATLIIKGMAPYGVVALEEMDRVCEKLRARQQEPNAWWEEWGAMGDAIERKAEAAAAKGHKYSAGDYYLRAGHYHYNAERFIRPGPEKKAQAQKAYRCWHAGIRLRHPNIEFVEVPYEGRTLPALFMKAHGAGPAPTVVIFNGMDNAKEMSVFFAGLEFARRGMHTLAIDGPGQGESLRLRGMHSRYDYEVPGAAAYDYLSGRKEVDPARVAVMGYSFGGYYSSRIAAFEHRYAACIALSALHWDLAGWQLHIKEKNASAPKSVAQSNFQFQWVVGAATPDEAIEIARKFTLKDVAKNIRCPFLVTHAGNDRVVPVENAQKLYDAVGSTRKTIKIFSTEEGGAEHAHVDNRQVGIDFAADWLAEVA
ncbi:MAG TPA: alpha/beta fold hydrolase [Burkholderiales bacterium]|jgi:dienelactone hydrolase